MGPNIPWCLSLLLFIANKGFCEEVSLQGALSGVDRRQDLINYPKYEKFYSESGMSRYVPENDLVFLGQTDLRGTGNREKSPMEYLEDMNLSNRQSPFRERKLQENRLREQQNLPEITLNEAKNSPEYADLLRELYQKYNTYEPQVPDYYGDMYEKNELRKKNRRYSNMGLNAVGMKKRSQSYPSNDDSTDSLYLYNVPNMRNQIYENSMAKRFPVTKRSSTYYPSSFTNEIPPPFKKSSYSDRHKRIQTDPKVEFELSSIFNHNANHKQEKREEEDKTVTKPKRTEHATQTSKTTDKVLETTTTTTQKPENKENVSDDNQIEEKGKPIQIKKKSIDWSDYFGIDKRKKSNNPDNEWLMERYHKAVALTSKRNSDNMEDSGKTNRSRSSSSTDEKIVDMDNKLKNIEYAIVDDALKASRTQETEFDTKEVREMKDRIISQLAAAYSLEKMRRALNEYRESIKKERLALKQASKEEGPKEEEKRLSVPRKSAGNMETPTSDNNIKCSNGDENCMAQNYRTPEDLLENLDFGYCPNVERACEEIASVLGQYERVVASACTVHQMCLLCGDNNWFVPVRQCNELFLNKVDYLCNGYVECKEVARHSTRYLLELNKLLKSEHLDKCDLTC